MAAELIVAVLVTAITVALHARLLAMFQERYEELISLMRRTLRRFANTSLAIVSILYTFGALLVQVGVWAIVLYAVGAARTVEAALYVSLMSFTTLGFSDAEIASEWRLLAGMIGVDGFLLFGWSTAFMVDLLRRTS